MAQGIALTIGLNSVDPNHYAGWSGDLVACEADADDMTAIAKSQGFMTTTLLTKEATRDATFGAIRQAAGKLKKGDTFLLCYSGHGGQLPDPSGEEPDGQNETWCLFDGEVVDDELHAELCGFAAGVRIFVTSDSCHSGTMVRIAYATLRATRALHALTMALPDGGESGDVHIKAMPPEVAIRTYRNNREMYDKVLAAIPRDPVARMKASAILISGCQDNQLSSDGTFNGLFTANLLRVWNNGRFEGSYRRFHRAIQTRMPPVQSPNFFRIGPPDRAFEIERPFTIEPRPRAKPEAQPSATV